MSVRVDIWLDPFADPLGAGYQVVQSLHAFARGGLIGTGLGEGLPMVGGRLPIPEVHTDFPLAALGEELGLVGVIAILGLYFVVIERGLRIGASAADDFRAILATSASRWSSASRPSSSPAGNLKVLPLTGVTLPFISYGGSSLSSTPSSSACCSPCPTAASSRRLPDRRPPLAPTGFDHGGRADARDGQAPPAARADHHPRRHRARAGVRPPRRCRWLGQSSGRPVSALGVRPRGHRRAQAERSPRGDSTIATANVLTSNEKDANGELYRSYTGPAISHVVGYASPRYGRAGLELAYDAELSGLAGDPAGRCAAQVRDEPYDPKDLHLAVVGPPAGGRPRPGQPARRGRDARSARSARSWRSRRPRPTTRRRSPTRRRRTGPFEALRDDPDQPLLPRRRSAGTCRARCSRS